MILADWSCLENSEVFGQGILGLVREKSVKSQGILCSIVCGNPVINMENNFGLFYFHTK